MKKTSLEGFSKLTQSERFKKLADLGYLTKEDLIFLKEKTVPDSISEHLIENSVGYFHMPLGIATHFVIDKNPYCIPMAVEETSVVAAASKTAKWISQKGYVTTEQKGNLIIGQIQIAKTKNLEKLKSIIQEHKQDLLKYANKLASGWVTRGGGFVDLKLRTIKRQDEHIMSVMHVYANPVDSMGANIMNQVCEAIKPKIEALSEEKISMCILSNLADTKLFAAQVVIEDIDPALGTKIEEASLFAQVDPYRAATNNKGVLNGIDPILIATGNDWRAVEAGIHAYASRNGQYTSLTTWKMQGRNLVGYLEIPVSVGIIGGVTGVHPTAKLGLKILKVKNSSELSRVITAVGLIQNLGALKALVTDGIVVGHMKLHASNLALQAGASKLEVNMVKQELNKLLLKNKKVSTSDATSVLQQMR